MSMFKKLFNKETPVSNTLQESESVTKARALVSHYEELKNKINNTKNIIGLLKYALGEGKDNVVLRITRNEPGNTWYTYDHVYPVEHVLYIDESIKEKWLKNMLSDYTEQLNEYENEYKNL